MIMVHPIGSRCNLSGDYCLRNRLKSRRVWEVSLLFLMLSRRNFISVYSFPDKIAGKGNEIFLKGWNHYLDIVILYSGGRHDNRFPHKYAQEPV
jgi:hypothetical protein